MAKIKIILLMISMINETLINIGTLFFASLPFFHALTGAENTSAFHKKNKIFALEASKSFPINSESFAWVLYILFSIFDEKSWEFKMIERFIIVLMDRVNIHDNVNEALREMFFKKSWNFEKIPLTQHAVHFHIMKDSLLIRQ